MNALNRLFEVNKIQMNIIKYLPNENYSGFKPYGNTDLFKMKKYFVPS